MNSIIKKAVAILMIFSLFGSLGCAPNRDKAGDKLLQMLEEKYGEEFVLEGIGGGYGTMNNNTLKAIVRPKRDSSMRVFAEITKDLKQVFDDYLAVVVAKNNIPQVEAIAREIWPDARVDLANDMGPYASTRHTDLDMSYQEFIELYPMNTLLIRIYLNADHYINPDGSMDEESEYEKYKNLSLSIADNGYVRSFVSIIYTNPKYYAQFDEAINSEINATRYYKDIEKNDEIVYVSRNGYKISDGVLITSKDEIKEIFDIWKDKREKYASQRGDS